MKKLQKKIYIWYNAYGNKILEFYMEKKILFTAYTLDVGGIETALVNLLNELIKKYDITLVLEKKQGVFLKELNNNIYLLSSS